ncbi:MAG TPA: ABC transporter substrate-binding protein [Pseudonocardia sp.]|uniref:ABC transporter substrate-binding protein n=1 Tax=Pseudonocardia sp. TaxID=60912 RepID=UPI002B4ABF61|nr:ABC transporter substrate-binding protein [Pseudonocardia sp.]HLU55179.1 ABC transporter substrate-binding protein [Pseudonocardia sp.]
MFDWSRRRFLQAAGLAGLGLTAACSGGDTASGGGGTTSVRVALGWITNVEFAGFWIADDRGYYREEGLEVEFLPGGPNAPSPVQTLAAGGAEIAIPVAMQEFISAVNDGNDFVSFGTMFQNSPAAWLSLAQRPVRSAADAVGARVLGQQGVQPYVEAAMRLAGVPVDYEFIPVGYEPSPLLEGQGDLYTCFATNQPITLEQQGMVAERDFIVTTYEQLGLPQYAGMLCSQRSWLDANRPVVERFMRATVRGWQDNAADPTVAARLAVEVYGADLGLDLAQQTRENELQIPYTQSELTQASGLFRIDPERIAGPMYTAYEAAGVSPLPEVSRIVDTTVLDAVFQGGATV